MLQINERPNITSAISTEDGYMVRTLCLVDGFPAEVSIKVDTSHRQKYSTYDISVYDQVEGRWKHVADMRPEEVGRMPILHDEPETLVELNRVAALLWEMANLITRTARIRQAEMDEQEYVYHRLALDTARQTAQDDLEYAEQRGGVAMMSGSLDELRAKLIGHDAGVDPLASGDHDEAEQAADDLPAEHREEAAKAAREGMSF